ncbi:uncharacterized protein N7473_000816 [Penicillium subrubescens]|uniref:Uncharacterized protein n=1 Tax=Penicillium subrubescens TaxID=1316194 RepID=A0A1Q5T0I6_9EURO|nr:uncharacterized protein N7473_000816 [Penicillium subrubescens]KAJ5911513.1 hypothetical protein N7473_000816 [Penicillium subrubescens]OKO93753.1 hypothetical protein PENSUB_12032 [Penicillium subrubescens]
MGLIKTGLTLAGGYALIKAASKAVNDHEDKKQRRTNQSQNQPQQGNMQENQMYHHSSQPQYHHGNHNAHNIRDNQRGFENPINQSPPPYHQAGSAQEYYSGKKL